MDPFWKKFLEEANDEIKQKRARQLEEDSRIKGAVPVKTEIDNDVRRLIYHDEDMGRFIIHPENYSEINQEEFLFLYGFVNDRGYGLRSDYDEFENFCKDNELLIARY